jgi:hypothetical protein
MFYARLFELRSERDYDAARPSFGNETIRGGFLTWVTGMVQIVSGIVTRHDTGAADLWGLSSLAKFHKQ